VRASILYNPTYSLKSARILKKDRTRIDPFTIDDAETLIAAIHRDWGEAQGNYTTCSPVCLSLE
jgi:hypothetical protein